MTQYRILQVMGTLNRGGAETLLMNIYREIDRKKIQFDFIVHSDDANNLGDYKDEILELGGHIYSFPKYRIINHVYYKKMWNKFFEDHNEYKVIHGHIRSTASIYLKIAKKHGLVTIAHSHSISSGKGFEGAIKSILQYKIRFVADYFMGCSKKANEWLFGKKIAKSNKCRILKNGIDIKKFSFNETIRKKVRKKLNITDGDILIGHVARFSNEKNQIFALEVLKDITKDNKKYKLIFIGDGPDKEKIIKRTNELNLKNNVIFLGSVPNVYEYLNAMDIFIFPSLYEGLGMALIEAQISGLKCLASKNVPLEAKITDNVKFLSLTKKEWKLAIEKGNTKRKKAEINEKCSEYDIKNISKQIQNFYIELEEKNGD